MNSVRLRRRWTSGPAGRHLRVRLKANNRQFNGTYFRGGSQLDSFKEGSLVHVIFCLEPVWNPPEWENKQDIRLKILHIEAVPHLPKEQTHVVDRPEKPFRDKQTGRA